jgi:hypothetical protein
MGVMSARYKVFAGDEAASLGAGLGTVKREPSAGAGVVVLISVDISIPSLGWHEAAQNEKGASSCD